MADEEFGGTPSPPAHDARGQAAPDHALRHRTEDTRTYPCTVCGSELEFHIGEQRLRCPSCGTVAAFAEGDEQVAENDLRAALAVQQARQHDHQSLVQGEKEIVCQNCGGHTTFTGTWTAQRCPYCATPIQRDDVHDAPERLPVDGVLPFSIERTTAEGHLKDWVSSRWFAPNEFKEYSRAGSFESVYSAYFTYDAETDTAFRGQTRGQLLRDRRVGQERTPRGPHPLDPCERAGPGQLRRRDGVREHRPRPPLREPAEAVADGADQAVQLRVPGRSPEPNL